MISPAPEVEVLDAPGETEAVPSLVLVGPTPPRRRNPARAYLDALQSKTSRATQERALVMILRELRTDKAQPPPSIDEFPWHMLRREHARWIHARLCARTPPYQPATMRRLLTALRRVFHASWDLGYIDVETRERCMDLPAVRGESPPPGHEVLADEVARLFAACDPSTRDGARSIAALALLFGGGLRREEATSVTLASLDLRRGSVGVLGKGRRYRDVPLGDWMPEIKRWLTLRGTSPGPLLCRLGRWDRIMPSEGITPSRLYGILTDVGERASPPVDFAPHDARRTVLTALLRKKVDARFVQKFAGHKSINTTVRYDMRQHDEMVAAVEQAGRVTLGEQATAKTGREDPSVADRSKATP